MTTSMLVSLYVPLFVAVAALAVIEHGQRRGRVHATAQAVFWVSLAAFSAEAVTAVWLMS